MKATYSFRDVFRATGKCSESTFVCPIGPRPKDLQGDATLL